MITSDFDSIDGKETRRFVLPSSRDVPSCAQPVSCSLSNTVSEYLTLRKPMARPVQIFIRLIHAASVVQCRGAAVSRNRRVKVPLQPVYRFSVAVPDQGHWR